MSHNTIIDNQRVLTIDSDKAIVSDCLVFLLSQPGVEPPVDLLWRAYAFRAANKQTFDVLYEEAQGKWHADSCV